MIKKASYIDFTAQRQPIGWTLDNKKIRANL